MANGNRSQKTPRVAALTCTGGREHAFHLCKGFIARQTQKPDDWVVVDDCIPKQKVGDGPLKVYPTPSWHLEMGHTLPRNMIAGLKAIKDLKVDIVTIFEDDDWYSPVYLERMSRALMSRYHDGVRVVGEMNTVFYNVQTRTWKQNWHPCHASLCSVSLHVDVIDEIISIIEYNMTPNIDHRIFETIEPKKVHLEKSNLVLGIKGLPDTRAGASPVHLDIAGRFVRDDSDLHALQAFIGDDAELYKWYYNGKEPPRGITELKVRKPSNEPLPRDRVKEEIKKEPRYTTESQRRYARMRKEIKEGRS